MEFSIGCDENGIIQGVAAEVIAEVESQKAERKEAGS